MTIPLINREALLPGDIIHRYSPGVTSWFIQRAIGSRGSHDAMVCRYRGELFIGEALMLKGGVLTPIETYENHMRDRGVKIAVLRMPGATDLDRKMANEWFLEHAKGMPYDWYAYPRLIAKALLGDWFKSQAGAEWAWYCTEAVRGAWSKPGMSANHDAWNKNNPTPRTTEKRVESGRLHDISALALTAEGLQYRLDLKGPYHA